jgi:predicted XRE-type DNA-binding protein
MKKNQLKTFTSKTPESLAEALELDKSVAVVWQVRHEVTERIISVFGSKEITNTDLAKRAETSRARITRILKRDTGDISLDVLIRMLGTLGQKVRMKISKVA